MPTSSDIIRTGESHAQRNQALNAPSQVRQWLLAGNWPALGDYFSRQAPVCAADYQARALLRLQQKAGAIDWRSVVFDMRRASELDPQDPLILSNLIQALLDSGQAQEAYETAKHAVMAHPGAYPAWEKLAFAAAAVRKWPEAMSALVRAQDMRRAHPLPEPAAKLAAELSSRWWEPIVKGGLVLRRPEPSDRAFLIGTFGNEEFMRHYHRFQGASSEAVDQFVAKAQLSPRQSRRIDWIILDRGGNRLGLAAIVDIDWGNERGELLIGLPGQRTQTVALRASVAILEFAFERLRLAKMTSYVYGDNPEAQANTLHLGFDQEGVLRSHIATPSGRLDLFVNGMTRVGFAGNALLARLLRRWGSDEHDNGTEKN